VLDIAIKKDAPPSLQCSWNRSSASFPTTCSVEDRQTPVSVISDAKWMLDFVLSIVESVKVILRMLNMSRVAAMDAKLRVVSQQVRPAAVSDVHVRGARR
jgi:hypothetical protein